MIFLLEAALELELEKQGTDGHKPRISILLQGFLDNYIWHVRDITTPFISHVPF